MKFLGVLLFVLLSAASFYLTDKFNLFSEPASEYNLVNIKDKLAGVFFVASTNEDELKNKYASAKNGGVPVKILLVPGHDNASVGTQFKNVKEADLTLELAERLALLLNKESGFQTFVTRDRAGYSPQFSSYFESGRTSIIAFAETQRLYMKSALESGLVSSNTGVQHNNASKEAVIKLYGINKWANENDVDLVISIHFNDQGGRQYNEPGSYSGFAIYVPEKQFSNSKASAVVARNIFERLNNFFAASDLPQESSGIVEEQELIAVGSNNSLDPAGMLIEYDYIYEPQFQYKSTREKTLTELAFQTYAGIKDFFYNATSAASFPETTLLPHRWNVDLEEGMVGNADVLSLQAALIQEGFYPPRGFTKNDCPITGSFKKCTTEAVKEFQGKNGLEPTGYVGPRTRKILNEKYAKQEQ